MSPARPRRSGGAQASARRGVGGGTVVPAWGAARSTREQSCTCRPPTLETSVPPTGGASGGTVHRERLRSPDQVGNGARTSRRLVSGNQPNGYTLAPGRAVPGVRQGPPAHTGQQVSGSVLPGDTCCAAGPAPPPTSVKRQRTANSDALTTNRRGTPRGFVAIASPRPAPRRPRPPRGPGGCPTRRSTSRPARARGAPHRSRARSAAPSSARPPRPAPRPPRAGSSSV
jgi:hypothetical protein